MFKSRIAPTPSGYLHIGNACNFLITWLWTRAENAPLFLRIDDLDRSRKRPEYVEDIFQTLKWLGLDWDEGPSGPEDFEKNWSQHLRLDHYTQALEHLKEQGLLFACDCTRSQIMEQSENGQYTGRCYDRALDFDAHQLAWRVRTDPLVHVQWQDAWQGRLSMSLGDRMQDFVVRRKDKIPAYQLASVVDDRLFGISAVLRGEDLLSSTTAQIWLDQQLADPRLNRVRWAHHPLLVDQARQKLSKSAGSQSILAMRNSGAKASTIYEACANLMGWSGKFNSLEQLLEHYIRRPKITYDP
ncbi:MAG: glutamate--tRNA ligase family protein [Bacteroidota bacterium]